MFIVDLQSNIPVFEQLKKQILEFISAGILNPNDQLPSVRSLAVQLGVNPNTVSKAYQQLENDGILYSLKGRGCFVAEEEVNKKINDSKLNEYRNVVTDMKKHQVEIDDLKKILKEVYGE